jgi:hypothetical protein
MTWRELWREFCKPRPRLDLATMTGLTLFFVLWLIPRWVATSETVWGKVVNVVIPIAVLVPGWLRLRRVWWSGGQRQNDQQPFGSN